MVLLIMAQVRAAGVSATTTVQWLSNMLVAALFPIASARFGMQPILFGFASVCVLAWALVFGCLPETKGVALEDIDLSAAGGGGAAVAGAKKKAD